MWVWIARALLLGYLSLGRSFAYLGIQPLKLFIGDIVLAAFLVGRPSEFIEGWIASIKRRTPLRETHWAFTLFLLYGVILVIKGVAQEYPLMSALQDFVCHVYPIYFFLGAMVGSYAPEFLTHFTRLLGWVTGIYGIAYLVVLSNIPLLMPGTANVPVFGQPSGIPLALLGLIAFESVFAEFWAPFLLNFFVMLADQVRSDWLGFTVGFFLWCCLKRQVTKLAAGVALLVVVMQIGFVFDVRFPGPRGEISSRAIVARALSPVAPELAEEYGSSRDVRVARGTSEWRKKWWALIWESVHEDRATSLTGHGYGYPLSYLAPFIRDEAIRTPHNIFFFLLGYGGWINVVLFVMLQLAVLLQLIRTYRITGQCFGVVVWTMTLTSSFFGNVFETPFGAIPLYLVLGISIGPLIRHERQQAGFAQQVDYVRLSPEQLPW